MSDKKYSNITPEQLIKLKKLTLDHKKMMSRFNKENDKKLRKEKMDETRLKVRKKVQTLRWKDRKSKDSD